MSLQIEQSVASRQSYEPAGLGSRDRKEGRGRLVRESRGINLNRPSPSNQLNTRTGRPRPIVIEMRRAGFQRPRLEILFRSLSEAGLIPPELAPLRTAPPRIL